MSAPTNSNSNEIYVSLPAWKYEMLVKSQEPQSTPEMICSCFILLCFAALTLLIICVIYKKLLKD